MYIYIYILNVALLVQWLEFAVANGEARVRFSDSASSYLLNITTFHDWLSRQLVGLIILRSWVRSPHCANLLKLDMIYTHHWRSW